VRASDLIGGDFWTGGRAARRSCSARRGTRKDARCRHGWRVSCSRECSRFRVAERTSFDFRQVGSMELLTPGAGELPQPSAFATQRAGSDATTRGQRLDGARGSSSSDEPADEALPDGKPT
jgi:hypothetical protein